MQLQGKLLVNFITTSFSGWLCGHPETYMSGYYLMPDPLMWASE